MAWSKARFQAAAAHRGPHKGRLPRAAEPVGLMRNYRRRMEPMRRAMIEAVRVHVVPLLEHLAANASRLAVDADDPKKSLGDAIDAAQGQFDRRWSRAAMRAIVEPVSKEVPVFAARQTNKQLSAAIGESISVDIVGAEAWVANAAAEWTTENVALIKSIPDQFFPDLEKNLAAEIADGARWEQLADTIEERYGVTAARAELIARDQIGKYVGDLNRVRQEELGITQFVWRTMGDERVRTDETAGGDLGHAERNGKVYSWEDPPEGETPGEPIQCRCWAEAVIASAE